jgi:hypothetical protein
MRGVVACGAVVVTLLSPSTARAEVIDVPPPVGGCTEAASWDAIGACLKKASYTSTQLRAGATWKLLEVEAQRDPTSTIRRRRHVGERLLTLYVHQPARRTWVLGGHVSVSGVDYELLAAEQTKIRKHDVWRIDLGQAMTTPAPMLDGHPVPSLLRHNRTIYCNGTSPYCSEVFTACEVLVRGRAWFAFRGTAKLVDGDTAIHIAGDRRRAGDVCRMPERVQLHLP